MTRAAATIGLVLSVLVLAWAAWSWWSPPSASPSAVTPTQSASLTPRPTASTTGKSSKKASPTPKAPTATRVEHIALPGADYSAEVGTMAVADSGVINPPDFQRMWWIRDRGVIPNSDPTDTAYLACHTNAAKSASVVPCNDLTLDNTRAGSLVHVTTDTEQLTYTVTGSRKVLRDDFASDREVWDVNPGRLVIVSCFLSEGRRTDYNIVVIAELDR